MALVETLAVGPLGCNMTIIADPNSLEAVVVDPGGDIEAIWELVTRHGLTVKQILITHAHVDHFLAAEELKELTGAPVCYNPEDQQLWGSLPLQCMMLGISQPKKAIKRPTVDLTDGQELAVRGGRVMFTPGHTKGSVCFYFQEDALLCSGDTLFRQSIGRTDFPGNAADKMQSSLQLLMTLPLETRVITGHGPETTIGFEKLNNPFLR
jgi:glyoxylase-like metal-dependent hydrolase (beta-lactamase superfamily II)